MNYFCQMKVAIRTLRMPWLEKLLGDIRIAASAFWKVKGLTHVLLNWFIDRFYPQNWICIWNDYNIWPKNDGEKWFRKNIFEIPPYAKQSLLIFRLLIYLINGKFFAQSYRFCNMFVHEEISKKFFVLYMHTINETLSQKLHPYSILSM